MAGMWDGATTDRSLIISSEQLGKAHGQSQRLYLRVASGFVLCVAQKLEK
jgi:hypothetical protein